jgi:hypothetical protein
MAYCLPLQLVLVDKLGLLVLGKKKKASIEMM